MISRTAPKVGDRKRPPDASEKLGRLVCGGGVDLQYFRSGELGCMGCGKGT